MSEEYAPLPRLHPAMAAMAGGALWGAMGYAVLWGLSPIVASRAFVLSVLGTALFFPVRVVLWALRWIEGIVGRPFEFAHSNWWIGVAAALVGAAIGVVLVLATRGLVHRPRGASP